MKPKTFFLAMCCLLLSASVVMNGLHAKDVVGVVTHIPRLDIKAQDDVIKIALDLHHHTDKQTLKSLLQSDTPQADNRSLRLIRHEQSTEQRWLHLRVKLSHWWNQMTHVIGLS